ncbi:hypothetical protein HELRODRAFT_68553 [Helobdella robusta]|uniref:Calcium channel flower n=1 Tax=Helobdella robusta TaxID=6412 RepID=T1FZG6_HELRO|nr:hypothetical protein HELRODRAFT_68553 [Helobdella robusta]ESN96068.1 hypothetical protein HELRODRAFT_68553 [Helobdella robusta]
MCLCVYAVCFAMGIWTCISIHILSIVAGAIQIVLAMIVLIFEVPVCCQFFQLTRPISQFSDRVSSMQRAFIFSGLAIIPVALYFTVSTVIGCGLVFSVGVIYGLMALGKK